MKKSMLISLVVLWLVGCSEQAPSPEPLKKKLSLNKKETKTKASVEFIPEHIKKSKIEVVKHY